MVANIDGNYYALTDRCGHGNALLSMGNICENIVTCPLHTAQFDVTTPGKKVREPSLPTGLKVDNLPNDWKRYLVGAYKVISCIKTYDQEKYDVKIDGDKVKVILPVCG
jgi:nitrite reductase/ring-hydroxylating ferredoxin subunit